MNDSVRVSTTWVTLVQLSGQVVSPHTPSEIIGSKNQLLTYYSDVSNS